MGYLRVGLDSDAPKTFDAVELRRPLALVLGAEDKGLRRLTRENCDSLGEPSPAGGDQEPERLQCLRSRARSGKRSTRPSMKRADAVPGTGVQTNVA